MERFDTVIIGGGIVGLATALALTRNEGLDVAVIEAENRIAAHQTGHNSGVIHAGLYYKPDSLKAKFCAKGRESLYRFCAEHSIKHERCGKLVIATNDREIAALDELECRGRANGLTSIQRLDADGIREYEPHAAGIEGLHISETGIVDFTEVAQTMARIITQRGARIHLNTRFLGVTRESNALRLRLTTGDMLANSLINCAGLHADRIARMCGSDPGCRIVPFRGEYYELAERSRHLVRNLIYPVPDARFPFLGVHLTRMITGGVEAGPNAVLALARHGYRWCDVNVRDLSDIFTYRGAWSLFVKHWRMGLSEVARSLSKAKFAAALRKLMPEIQASDLAPGGAGVRAQAVDRTGKLIDDFHIVKADRMVHVLNAPSPAATSSLAIGEAIASMLQPLVASSRPTVVAAAT
jgi:L-2-hydroxyglutarate oxidase